MPKIKINKRVVTPYQEIIDANITLFGKSEGINFSHNLRCIFINRMYQFCTDWYYEYHFFEYLVPTLFFNKNKSLNVLVIGGGDLIGTSMLLKYANIKHIDLIDIDKKMVKLGKYDFKAFDFIKKPFYKSKKLKIIIGDAFVVTRDILNKGKKYDLIIYDLPVVNNFKLLPLMSVEFFKRLRKLLKPGGFLSIYQEVGGEGMNPIKKESILIGCANFKKVLFLKGFKIRPSEHISYEDNFLYFTNKGDFNIKNKNLLKKMLFNDPVLLEKFYQSGIEFNLKCPANIKLNSIFRPDFSIIKNNEKNY